MNNLPESLESMIAAAKDYMVPTDNLRPRILEVARMREDQRHNSLRMFQIAALIFLGVIITIPAQQQLEGWRQTAFSPNSSQLELQAQEFASQPTIGQNWGMVEAFRNLRQSQFLKITGQ